MRRGSLGKNETERKWPYIFIVQCSMGAHRFNYPCICKVRLRDVIETESVLQPIAGTSSARVVGEETSGIAGDIKRAVPTEARDQVCTLCVAAE